MNPVTDPEGFATGMSIFVILTVAVSVIVPLGITGAVIYFIVKKLNANKQVIATGEPAQAQILSVSETGTSMNNQPEVAMALQVQR